MSASQHTTGSARPSAVPSRPLFDLMRRLLPAAHLRDGEVSRDALEALHGLGTLLFYTSSGEEPPYEEYAGSTGLLVCTLAELLLACAELQDLCGNSRYLAECE